MTNVTPIKEPANAADKVALRAYNEIRNRAVSMPCHVQEYIGVVTATHEGQDGSATFYGFINRDNLPRFGEDEEVLWAGDAKIITTYPSGDIVIAALNGRDAESCYCYGPDESLNIPQAVRAGHLQAHHLLVTG